MTLEACYRESGANLELVLVNNVPGTQVVVSVTD